MSNVGAWIKKNMFYVILAAVLVMFFLVSRFLFQIILVSGVSMEPTYQNHAVVIIDKRKTTPTYGQVIVFKNKTNGKNLIKRVVACPGDTVAIEDGTLIVSGKPSEVFPFRGIFDYAGILETEQTLGEGEYAVIGDNIPFSEDSRYEEVGIVKQETILGTLTQQKERE